MTVPDFTMALATDTDLPFVMALQRANRESVGGLPSPAIEDRIRRGTLLLGFLNGEPCGYLMYDFRDGIIRVPQACIHFDARRQAHGIALVGAMLSLCDAYQEVRLRCAADIAANLFWRALGFHCTTTVPGGSRRNRLINVWQKWADARLFGVDTIAQDPAYQRRIDCYDEQTGFPDEVPAGFTDMGELPLLAWSNRKKKIAEPA